MIHLGVGLVEDSWWRADVLVEMAVGAILLFIGWFLNRTLNQTREDIKVLRQENREDHLATGEKVDSLTGTVFGMGTWVAVHDERHTRIEELLKELKSNGNSTSTD